MAVKCSNCGKQLDTVAGFKPRVPCPACGCRRRIVEEAVSNDIKLHQQIGVKVRDPNLTGKKKHRLEITTGDDLHRQSGEWLHKDRTIDRRNDLYREVIADPKTGRVVRRCEEPLTKHRGHGSAKPRGGKGDPE